VLFDENRPSTSPPDRTLRSAARRCPWRRAATEAASHDAAVIGPGLGRQYRRTRQLIASLRVPAVVHTVHGAPFHRYQNPASRAVFQWCERYAAPRCHALISVADAMTDLMVNAGIAPREKFSTIYSGMDVEPFQGVGGQQLTALLLLYGAALIALAGLDIPRRELGFLREEILALRAPWRDKLSEFQGLPGKSS
jgi:hypothetical protein